MDASVYHLRDGFVLVLAILCALGHLPSSYTVTARHSSVGNQHDQPFVTASKGPRFLRSPVAFLLSPPTFYDSRMISSQSRSGTR